MANDEARVAAFKGGLEAMMPYLPDADPRHAQGAYPALERGGEAAAK